MQPGIFEQIESVCTSFKQEWRRGSRPSLDAFLNQLPAEAGTILFRNLLHTEIRYRRRLQEQPQAEDYLERFPEFAGVIRETFFESTIMSAATDPSKGAVAPVEPTVKLVETPPATRLGDYELLREIGRGGFGTVYEAQNLQSRSRVALKTLHAREDSFQDAEQLYKFRREFRSLADVNHPHLVGMRTLEVDGTQWFFTMDLVDGVDFLSFVRPHNRLDESHLQSVLPQLASAIMALHARKIVHRDLKPSNVLVDKDGRVIVLDFGLVVEMKQQLDQTMSLRSTVFAGTIPFAAPEQIKSRPSVASDWYAFGTMLYQALTGELPFSGSPQEILGRKQFEDAPKIAGRSDLPTDLAELADGLLQRDQKHRADALQVASVLSMNMLPPTTPETSSGGDYSIDGKTLVGRRQQLDQLLRLTNDLIRDRQAAVAFVTGRSGEGKTSLAEAFLQSVMEEDECLILSGRCYDRESVPYKAVDCIIDSLVQYLRGMDRANLRVLLPEDVRFLAHLFPVLRRVETVAAVSDDGLTLDSKQIQHRAFVAMKTLLA